MKNTANTILTERGYSFTTTAEREIVNEVNMNEANIMNEVNMTSGLGRCKQASYECCVMDTCQPGHTAIKYNRDVFDNLVEHPGSTKL